MGKIVSGIVGVIVALGALGYGVATEVRSSEVWFLQKIPFVLGLELPRILYLGLAVVWIGGAAQLIGTGYMEMIAVDAMVGEMRAGKSAADMLAQFVNEVAWANDNDRGLAKCMLKRIAYPRVVAALARKTGEPIDTVALAYKTVRDRLAERAALIRQAAAKVGVSADDLPPLEFPAARVVGGLGFFSGLSLGDLICSYDGNLVDSVAELQAHASSRSPAAKVKVGVIRYVQKTFHNPLSGIENDFAWETHTVEVKGGRFKDEALEDNATSAAVAEPAPEQVAPARQRATVNS